jgi:nicotinamide riboside transporter PnuC
MRIPALHNCPRTARDALARRRLEALGWTASAIAVAGVLLNNARNPWCFVLWLAANTLTAYLHARARMYALFVRDLVFLALAVAGLVAWGGLT